MGKSHSLHALKQGKTSFGQDSGGISKSFNRSLRICELVRLRIRQKENRQQTFQQASECRYNKFEGDLYNVG